MDPEMSHKNYNVCVTPWNGVRIYFWWVDPEMALEYILWNRCGKDIFFWSVGGVRGPSLSKKLEFFLLFRTYIRIGPFRVFPYLENALKIAEKSGKYIFHLHTIQGLTCCFQGQLCISKYRECGCANLKIAINRGCWWWCSQCLVCMSKYGSWGCAKWKIAIK